MPKTELTSMVMIENRTTGKVLVQERVKSWHGLAFPGGHVEPNESITDSAIREVKEETGLDIISPKLCGVVHWFNNETHDRYLVYLYKTAQYSGTLIEECDEGRHFWMDISALRKSKQENGFHRYIEVFTNDSVNEAFGSWNNDEEWAIVYK